MGLNYKRHVWYKVPNNVGKTTTKVYTKHILPMIKDDLLDRGLTLCQDHDLAHTSKITA
jgi:hypothetical protein